MKKCWFRQLLLAVGRGALRQLLLVSSTSSGLVSLTAYRPDGLVEYRSPGRTLQEDLPWIPKQKNPKQKVRGDCLGDCLGGSRGGPGRSRGLPGRSKSGGFAPRPSRELIRRTYVDVFRFLTLRNLVCFCIFFVILRVFSSFLAICRHYKAEDSIGIVCLESTVRPRLLLWNRG